MALGSGVRITWEVTGGLGASESPRHPGDMAWDRSQPPPEMARDPHPWDRSPPRRMAWKSRWPGIRVAPPPVAQSGSRSPESGITSKWRDMPLGVKSPPVHEDSGSSAPGRGQVRTEDMALGIQESGRWSGPEDLAGARP